MNEEERFQTTTCMRPFQAIEMPVERVAKGESDKLAIFKLRYKVYVEEMHRNQPHANHVRKTIIDPLDDTATLLGSFLGPVAVGTCRMNFSDSSRFENRAFYDFDFFEKEIGKVAFLTKMMILPAWRESTVFISLVRLMYRIALERGAKVGILDCNDHLVAVYRYLGFVPYKDSEDHPLYGRVTPMALYGYDDEHLRTINSPLLDICVRFKPRQAGSTGTASR